jgi:ABC-type glycerol-3-phosphate transport system permease component
LAASEVRIREGFRLGLAHLGYAAIAFVFLLPLWWAVVSSLRPNASVFADVFPFTAKALRAKSGLARGLRRHRASRLRFRHPQHASGRSNHDDCRSHPQRRGWLRIRDF